MTAVPPRSALLAAWGTAWLRGDVPLSDVVDRVTADDDLHTVTGLEVDDSPLERGLGRLRADGVVRLRVVLPVPGDLVGCPGPGPFTRAALGASEGVLALREDGTGVGLVPVVTAHGSAYDGTVTTVRWEALPVEAPGPEQGPFLHEAEHDLRIGLAEAARRLAELDVARWRPEVADELDEVRRQARGGAGDELPPSWPPRAQQVLVQARQVARIVDIARRDTGAAVDAREAERRDEVLRELARVVRRARVAAYNSGSTGS